MNWKDAYEAMHSDILRDRRFGTKFFIFEDVTDDVFPLVNTYICEGLPAVVETDRGVEIHLKDANRDRTLSIRNEGHTWSWVPRHTKLIRYSPEFSETTSLDEVCAKMDLVEDSQ